MSKRKANGPRHLTILSPYEGQHTKVIGFDIETSGNNNDFVLACFYSDDIKYVARTKQEVIDFIQQPELKNYNIFATNLAFDFLGSFYEKTDHWDFSERNGCIYSFKWYQQCNKWHSKDGTKTVELSNPVHFYDTLRIFPASVATLGKILNQHKMPSPKCFKRRPNNKQEEDDLIEYCMNDSKISYLFIKDIVVPFLEKYDLKFGVTIGNLAMKDFRTNHLTKTLFREPKINHDMAFGSYYGGRTETFKRGTFKNVYCFDINSLYPSVMLKHMPDPNRSYHNTLGTLYHIKNSEGVTYVKVKVAKQYMPPLPVHKNDKLLFPTGIIEGYYNNCELRMALDKGTEILEIGEQLIYPNTLPLFKSFIELHYKERRLLQKVGSID
jgi:hypothetical protein